MIPPRQRRRDEASPIHVGWDSRANAVPHMADRFFTYRLPPQGVAGTGEMRRSSEGDFMGDLVLLLFSRENHIPGAFGAKGAFAL